MKRTFALLACFTVAIDSTIVSAQGTNSQQALPDSPPSHLPAPPNPAWSRVARLHPGDSIAVLGRTGTPPLSCELETVSADTVTCIPWQPSGPYGEVYGPTPPRIVFPRASIATISTERWVDRYKTTRLIVAGAIFGIITISGAVQGGSSGALIAAIPASVISFPIAFMPSVGHHEKIVRHVVYRAPIAGSPPS